MARTKKQKRGKKAGAKPPGKRQMAATMIDGFSSTIALYDDHPTYPNVLLAAMHAATYIQLRSLISILPTAERYPKTRQWSLDVVERAAELSTEVFFHRLREEGAGFPPELPNALRDVFTAGHHGIIENALAMLEYESTQAATSAGDDCDGGRVNLGQGERQ